MRKKHVSKTLYALAMILGLGLATSAEASMKLPGFWGRQESRSEDRQEDRRGEGMDDKPGIRMAVGQSLTGTVTVIGTNTITVNGKHASTTGLFIVDVSSAKFFKNNATTTLNAILLGDTVFVQGKVSGNSVTASAVYSGKLPAALQKVEIRKEEKKEERKEKREDRMADRLRGTAILGIVTNVNGNTILVDGRFGTSTATTTYTVNAANAKIFKDKATTTVSAILVGDRVLVEGTVSGTTVTANVIFDGKLPLNGKAFGAFSYEPEQGKFFQKINNFLKNFFKKNS